jgi:hypothetical protein
MCRAGSPGARHSDRLRTLRRASRRPMRPSHDRAKTEIPIGQQRTRRVPPAPHSPPRPANRREDEVDVGGDRCHDDLTPAGCLDRRDEVSTCSGPLRMVLLGGRPLNGTGMAGSGWSGRSRARRGTAWVGRHLPRRVCRQHDLESDFTWRLALPPGLSGELGSMPC